MKHYHFMSSVTIRLTVVISGRQVGEQDKKTVKAHGKAESNNESEMKRHTHVIR